MGVSYVSPKLAAGDKRTGVVTLAPFATGEVVAAFGGRCVPGAEVADRLGALQIEDDLYLVDDASDPSVVEVPHSCDPTCVLSGSVVLVARRPLAAGEPINFDRATTMGVDGTEFACSCGAASCRGTVTANDWMLPELQLRYRGHFSPYLARRISSLAAIGAERRAFAL